MFETFIEHFHWLRPTWLLLIPAVALLIYGLWKLQTTRNNWQAHVDSALLPYLLDGKQRRRSRIPFIGLFIGFVIAALAMAGPAWENLPQPVHKTESALVIALDLSPSMLAEDLKPSRLVRARLKLIDLLNQRKEGLTALIVYAGEAHVVTPLTDDTQTIINLLPTLTPRIMPLQGSNPEMAAEQAQTLLKDAGLTKGDLLFVTDGIAVDASRYIKDYLNNSVTVSVLGIGTSDGAPIPTRGGFAKNLDGGIVISKLERGPLRDLAAQMRGRYSDLQTDNDDIDYLIHDVTPFDEETRKTEREFDAWQDRGAWLCLLLLPFALLAFRRGWLLSLALVILLPTSEPTWAQEEEAPQKSDSGLWQNLWQTPDQQGQKLLESDKAANAATIFDNTNWRGSAYYQAGNYEQAATEFAKDPSATGHYNHGNALANNGDLEAAKAAYKKTLKQQSGHADAKSNLELVEKLLEQQKQQQQNQKKSEDDDPKQDQSEQSDNQEQQDGSNQQKQEQQEQDQQGGEPQQSDSQSEQNNSESKPEDSQQHPENEEESQEASKPEAEPQAGEDESTEAANAEQGEEDTEASVDGEQPFTEESLTDEQRQAMEQWLRQIPDDPSGLIKRKFEYQYHQRKEQYRSGDWAPPTNEANKRW